MSDKVQTRGERNIEWIEEHLFIPEGAKAGQPFILEDFQKQLLLDIYDNPYGTRRAIISFGRKNGKTALSAALLLLHLVGPEARRNSQLFSAARSRQQAAILFDLACKSLLFSPTLRPYVKIRHAAKELWVEELGTLYKALSKDASTSLGYSGVFCVHDELGQVRSSRDPLYENIETGAGAHDNPLSIIISTQAPNNDDLLSQLIDDAKTGTDPRIVLRLFTADESLDPFSEEALKAANPAYGIFQNPAETKGTAEDARRMPARENEYRNLILNQRVEAKATFIARGVWDANGSKPEPWEGKEVYAALDLSTRIDLTSLTLVHANEQDDKFSVHPFFWLPEEGLADKSRDDRVPWDMWAKSGALLTTPGKTIIYDFIAAKLLEIRQKCALKAVAVDPYKFSELRLALSRADFTDADIDLLFYMHRQGFVSMNGPINNLESLLITEKLAHGNHPIMTMCVNNSAVITDSSRNRKLVKSGHNTRIDGAITLAMCAGMIESYDIQKPKRGSYLDHSELLIL